MEARNGGRRDDTSDLLKKLESTSDAPKVKKKKKNIRGGTFIYTTLHNFVLLCSSVGAPV